MGIIVDGQQVNIGDVICFKSDIEQCGRIKSIRPSVMGRGYTLTLEATSETGFSGDYIGGAMITTQHSSDCWVE